MLAEAAAHRRGGYVDTPHTGGWGFTLLASPRPEEIHVPPEPPAEYRTVRAFPLSGARYVRSLGGVYWGRLPPAVSPCRLFSCEASR